VIRSRHPRFEKAMNITAVLREHFEPSFEAVGLECFFPFLVVVGVVRIEPIALGVHGEIGDLRQFAS